MSSEFGRLGVYSEQRLDDRIVDEFLGLCRGVLLDGEVQEKEIVRLEEWCAANRASYAQWPLDVIATRILRVLEDGLVEDEERVDLAKLLAEVVGLEPGDSESSTSLPLTAPAPTVVFPEREFCFTGTFAFGTRKVCESAVAARKGRCKAFVSSSLSYVVVGSRATKAWMHSSYGRKIEEAVDLIRTGAEIAIISEAHWTRSLELAAPYDTMRVRSTLERAINLKVPVEFFYRGSRRVILPSAFVTWLNQPAIEGTYLAGDSPDPTRAKRQYLLGHVANLREVGCDAGGTRP